MWGAQELLVHPSCCGMAFSVSPGGFFSFPVFCGLGTEGVHVLSVFFGRVFVIDTRVLRIPLGRDARKGEMKSMQEGEGIFTKGLRSLSRCMP